MTKMMSHSEITATVWAMSVLLSGTVQQTSGLLSIDYDGTAQLNESATNLTWKEDGQDSLAGMNSGAIYPPNFSRKKYDQAISTLRYFPRRQDILCYDLPVRRNVSILRRGTVPLENSLKPDFLTPYDVYINATLWSSVQYEIWSFFSDFHSERLFNSLKSVAYICLNPHQGVPSILLLKLIELYPEGFIYPSSDGKMLFHFYLCPGIYYVRARNDQSAVFFTKRSPLISDDFYYREIHANHFNIHDYVSLPVLYNNSPYLTSVVKTDCGDTTQFNGSAFTLTWEMDPYLLSTGTNGTFKWEEGTSLPVSIVHKDNAYVIDPILQALEIYTQVSVNMDRNNIAGVLNLSIWLDNVQEAYKQSNQSLNDVDAFEFRIKFMMTNVPQVNQLEGRILTVVEQISRGAVSVNLHETELDITNVRPYFSFFQSVIGIRGYLCRSSVDTIILEDHISGSLSEEAYDGLFEIVEMSKTSSRCNYEVSVKLLPKASLGNCEQGTIIADYDLSLSIDHKTETQCITKAQFTVAFVLGIIFMLLGFFISSVKKWRLWQYLSTASKLLQKDLVQKLQEDLISESSPFEQVSHTRRRNASSSRITDSNASASIKSMMVCEGKFIDVDGIQHEPFSELHFKLDTSRNGKYKVVKLNLEQVDFGIKNCCTKKCSSRSQSCNRGRKCCNHFIQKITIQVSFTSTSANQCHRMSLQPQPACQVFVKQRTFSQSLNLSLCNIKESSLELQEGVSTSHTVSAYGWEAASRDEAKNSVTWTWAISNLADGSELRLNKTRSGKSPRLPISPAFFHMNSESFRAEAVWELEVPDESMAVEWKVNAVIKTVRIQKKKSFVHKLLGLYAFIGGEELTYEKLLTFQ